MDISDIDPCFTIIPENTDELFRDLEDSSGKGTQDSLLESVVLDLKLSIEGSDCDSFKTALSDGTMISLPPPWDFELDSILDDCHQHQILFKQNSDNEPSESSTIESLISIVVEGNLVPNTETPSTPLQEKDKSDSFYTPIDEIPDCAVYPASRNDYSRIVSDSGEESFASRLDSELEGNETLQDDISNASSQINDKPETTDVLEIIEKIPSIEGHGTEDTTLHYSMDDDYLGTNLCSVDSIDEWVEELMSHKPKENSE